MKINRTGGTGGAWLKKEDLKTGDVLKLVSEAAEVESNFGKQLVAKCRVKGHAGDAANIGINNASRNALIDAFGDDTKLWVDKLLTVEVERGTVSGKRSITLYLLPEGFSVTTDAGGYVVITKGGAAPVEVTTEYSDGVIDASEIPF